VEPFPLHVDDAVLADLKARLRNTRWPAPAPGEPWSQGTDLGYLRDLLAYWADGFDWRAQERELNRFHHYRTELDGVAVHYVHERATGGGGLPLILTHGWPSTFLEMLSLVPILTGRGFDVVVPSLPGYGFSARPARTGVHSRYVAGLWHRLMRELGYERYGAHGTDFGSAVTTYLALDHPAALVGIHLSNLDIPPYTGPGSRPLSPAEQAYVSRNAEWGRAEGGYREVQATKPQSLGYGLTDSPVGLAAWILEKWRSWSDSGGDLNARFGCDFLLTTVTLYWVTGTITTSMRDYYDNRWTWEPLRPDDFVGVPTGVAAFDNYFVDEGAAPREWAERLYNVVRWTTMPRGGHFAAVEEPGLLADDLTSFFHRLD
jgi:pimeloyl-ACP methyl ester carboxylesterase